MYSPAITDFIVMTKDTSYMFITGPEVIKTVTHEEVTKEDLGGALAHNQKSGVAHFAAENEQASILLTRELLSYLPSNNAEDPPVVPSEDDPFRAEASLRTHRAAESRTGPTTSRRSSGRWSTSTTSSRCTSTTRATSWWVSRG